MAQFASGIHKSYRTMWGLDRPLPEQYLRYISQVVQGDFGVSFRDDRPVAAIIAERIPATLNLGLLAFGITLLIGIPGGIVAAMNRGRLVDRVVMGFTILGHSLPNFFLGILLILYFSMTLRLLPSFWYRYMATHGDACHHARHIVRRNRGALHAHCHA